MMEFEPLVSPIFAWVFGLGILAGLIGLLVWISRSDFSAKRKALKMALNSFFLVSLLLFILNPVWNSAPQSSSVLVFSDEVTKADIDFWKDSLGVETAISSNEFQAKSDSIHLLGTGFSKVFLYGLRAKSLDWIIPSQGMELEYVGFKGILKRGEIQRIRGVLPIKSGSTLSLFQSGKPLLSQTFQTDQKEFLLELSASVVGRNEWEIQLDSMVLGTVRFFVQLRESQTIQLQFAFPNPEVRTLSRYLVGQGYRVQEEIQLSKNTALETERLPLDSVDVFVIDPSQLEDRSLQTQFKRGASFLVINLNDPASEVRTLNQAFGTDFSLLAIPGNEFRVLDKGLEVLPFEWKQNVTQRVLLENSIAIQQIENSKIAGSLLASSFALAQSGDSIAYENLWDRVFGELRPQESINWKLRGPLFQNQFFSVEFSGADSLLVSSEEDGWSQSLINPNSRARKFIRVESGWQRIVDGVEVYVSDSLDWSMVYAQRERSDFLKSKVWLASNSDTKGLNKSIPFWAWGLVFMILLAALWLEPKID